MTQSRPPSQFAETPKQARRFMDELYKESYLRGKVTAVDTEFVPITNEPVLMSYSWGRGIRRVVRAELVKEFFGDWLTDPQTKLAYQNYKADVETMAAIGIPEAELERSFYIDIMVAAVLRDETLVRHGLKEQQHHFLNWYRRGYGQLFVYVPSGKKKAVVMNPRQVMDSLPPEALTDAVLRWAGAKGTHKVGPRSREEWRQLMVDYAGDDAEGTQVLAVKHRRYLKATGYWQTYVDVDRPFTLTLMGCEDAGALIDQPVLRKILRKQDIRLLRSQHCFRAAAGDPKLNLRSGPQMSKLLFDEWGWPEHPSVTTDSGKPSMDKEVLTWWLREHKLRMAGVKLAFNNAATLKGTFLMGILTGISADGRLRSDLNQIGAKVSGRISSRKFDVMVERSRTLKSGEVKTWIQKTKAGANLQNIPARKEKDPDGIRGAFRAPLVGEITAWGDRATEPHKLLVADYSGFHLMLVIHFVSKLTKQSAMLDIMKKYGTPSAVHVYTTIQMFKHAAPHRCRPETCKDKDGNWKKHHGENKSFSLKEFTMADWGLVKPLFPDQYTYSKNCVTGETMILTEHGYRRIDELCAGAPLGRSKPAAPIRIASRDGLREVADVYRGGAQPVKKVTTDLGFAVRANDSHDMPVVRGGKVEMVKVADLRVGDLCIMKAGSNIHGAQTAIPSMEQGGATSYKRVNLPGELTPEVSRLLGYYVAEGYSVKSNTTYYTSFGFGPEDADMVADCGACLQAVVADRLRQSVEDGAVRYYVTSKDLHDWWRHLGCGEASADKQIPPCILGAPWPLKREFLRAYFAGDGSVSGGVVTAASKSELLIRQIQGELVNVGIACSVSPFEKEGYGVYWRVQIASMRHVRAFANLIGFACERKQRVVDTIDDRIDYSTMFIDGFTHETALVADRTSNPWGRTYLRQVSRGIRRLGETLVRELADDALAGTELGGMVADGLWTVRVRSIEPDGEAEVFDLYEPVHKVMVASGLLVGDTNFALIFLGSPWTLAYNTGRDANNEAELEECKRHFDDWYELYPEIPVYQNYMIDHGREHGWVPTIGGRRGHVRAMLEGCDRDGKYIQDEDKRKKMIKHGERVCTNTPAQGSEADIVKMALNLIHNSKKMRRLRVKPLFPVHDEIASEGPGSTATEGLAEQIRLMKLPYRDQMEFELAVEGGIGDNWISAKP